MLIRIAENSPDASHLNRLGRTVLPIAGGKQKKPRSVGNEAFSAGMADHAIKLAQAATTG